MTICKQCANLRNRDRDSRLWKCHVPGDGPVDPVTGEPPEVYCHERNKGDCPHFKQAGRYWWLLEDPVEPKKVCCEGQAKTRRELPFK